MAIVTWQDQGDWENTHCSAHAEGCAVFPSTSIKILDDETGGWI